MSKLKRYRPEIAEVINDHLEAELISKLVVYVLPVLLMLVILTGLLLFIFYTQKKESRSYLEIECRSNKLKRITCILSIVKTQLSSLFVYFYINTNIFIMLT